MTYLNIRKSIKVTWRSLFYRETQKYQINNIRYIYLISTFFDP